MFTKKLMLLAAGLCSYAILTCSSSKQVPIDVPALSDSFMIAKDSIYELAKDTSKFQYENLETLVQSAFTELKDTVETVYTLTTPMSNLSIEDKKVVLNNIVNALAGKYECPVLGASDEAMINAFSLQHTSYEFGAKRPKHRKHKGVDVYGYGKAVVAFADGKIKNVGRYINKQDHGNIIIIDHGNILGHNVQTYYLHIGGVRCDLEEGAVVKKGDILAMVDCSGISDKGKFYRAGSKSCQRNAHLHFQIKIDDFVVNPSYFFGEYDKNNVLSKLKSYRLGMYADVLDDDIKPFRGSQRMSSFIISENRSESSLSIH